MKKQIKKMREEKPFYGKGDKQPSRQSRVHSR